MLGLLWGPVGALANPGLRGAWSGQIEGQPLAVQFDGAGGGSVDGRRIRYQVDGDVLVVEDQGTIAFYRFELRGDRLRVAGGALPGIVELRRDAAEATRSPGGAGVAGPGVGPGSTMSPSELVGRWCRIQVTSSTTTAAQRSACFELRADGSYVYGGESSLSGGSGSMASSASDSGLWSLGQGTLTSRSRTGQVNTFRLEKRNHPRNRDPMLCLDGDCYVTWQQRPPWPGL